MYAIGWGNEFRFRSDGLSDGIEKGGRSKLHLWSAAPLVRGDDRRPASTRSCSSRRSASRWLAQGPNRSPRRDCECSPHADREVNICGAQRSVRGLDGCLRHVCEWCACASEAQDSNTDARICRKRGGAIRVGHNYGGIAVSRMRLGAKRHRAAIEHGLEARQAFSR